MLIGFGILLNGESFNLARKLELELCKKFGLCWGLKQPPHITIKCPFETKELDKFTNYLQDLSKNVKSFEIELEDFNYFEPKVIFLDVKENPKLKKLHFKIIKDLKEKFCIEPHQFEGNKIKFHSTLAVIDVTKQKFLRAKKYLEKYKPKLKFKAKSIGIFYYLGKNAGWIIVKEINLKN